ncbi:MAG TPA: PfkB family carbohydrate kinase, partial [Roseiflexaceae bacterium]
MSTNLSTVIDSFTGLDVLVIGDAMLDSYMEGTAGGLCREAPVPVVTLSCRVDVPGGAANTAANVRALGGRVRLLAAVGDDPEAAMLRRALASRGVAADHLLVRPARQTLAKHRVVAASQVLVRFDQGSRAPIDGSAERALIERLAELFPACDAVVISDYDYGVLTPRVIRAIARLQAETPRVLVADSRRLAAYRGVGVTAVKPNYRETLDLLGDRTPAD